MSVQCLQKVRGRSLLVKSLLYFQNVSVCDCITLYLQGQLKAIIYQHIAGVIRYVTQTDLHSKKS